ncbi:hypothetical protein [Peribacillus simplex]|uniref:Apea-like HEPN domain-containing protein n=1 Tax=Peribacillus simplex TaxID=1478 RepID=A0AAN2PB63_9BACI|nr:hypothetical protein [Peribacillus simplex]CEG24548.1 hypothetical protein BN1180_05363 [Peribacillus simplex]
MIKFLLFQFKHELEDYEDYYDYVEKKIKVELVSATGCNILEMERSGSIFDLQIAVKEENFKVELNFRNEEHIQITVTVNKNDTYNKALEDTKLALKDIFRPDFNQCIWLEDVQSNDLSFELYNKVHIIENKLRHFINLILFNKLDNKWWDFIPKKIKDNHQKTFKSAKDIAPCFNNINDYLLSIYSTDLGDILTLEIKKWEPNQDEFIENLLVENNVNKNANRVYEKLKEQLKTKMSFWDIYFKQYLSPNFMVNWNLFCVYRNHIAHNKLVNYSAFNEMNVLFNDLLKELDSALSKVEDEIIEADFNLQIEDLNLLAEFLDGNIV